MSSSTGTSRLVPPRQPAQQQRETVYDSIFGGQSRTVFDGGATGQAAALAQQDYRRGLIAAKSSGQARLKTYRAPPMARLCDEMLFGSQLARHRAAVDKDEDDDPAAERNNNNAPPGRLLLAPSFMLLIPTCLMGTIAQTTLTPILPQLKQQFFGTGHAAASVSGWTDSLGYW